MFLEAKRQYAITPQAMIKLEALCGKILALIDQWKHRATQQAVSSGHSSTQLQQELARYISKQTNQQLFIGTVKGFDHTLREERTFRVLLQAGTNVGAYFDDYMDTTFLEFIKLQIAQSNVDAVAKKYKVKKSVVQYAQETPVKDLQPLRGRGDIVLDLNSVLVTDPVPEIMDLLTHELTHGVQTLAPSSGRYGAAITRLHAGEELNRHHTHGYFRERSEFEAQLNGMLANLKYKYQQKGDANNFRKEMSEKHTDSEIAALMRGTNLEQTLKTRQQKFKQMLIDRLLNTPREVAMEIDKHGDKIEQQISDLYSKAMDVREEIDSIEDSIHNKEHETEAEWERAMEQENQLEALQREYETYRDQGVALENKYFLIKTTKRPFITAIAGNKRLWDIYHKALSEFISSLN